MSSLVLFLDRLISLAKRKMIKTLANNDGECIFLFSGEVESDLEFSVKTEYTPLTFTESFNLSKSIKEAHVFDSRKLIDINNVRVDTKTGIVFSKDASIIGESSSWPSDRLTLSSPYLPIFSAQVVNSSCVNLVLPANGFYHWLIEDLPLFLFALRNTQENSKVFYYKDAPSYVKDFIREIDADKEEVTRGVRLPNLRFVTRGPDTGWPLLADVLELRSHFGIGRNNPKTESKLYISRVNSKRSPEFERQLEIELESSGWNVISMEDLTLSDQIQTFSMASKVCGVHGAGLAGITWMNPGSKVFELSPSKYRPCFSRLASIVNVDYELINYEVDESENAIDRILSRLNT